MAVSHSNCPGALSLQTYHRLQHQVHLLCTRLAHFSLHPRILGHRCPPKLAHLTTPQCPSHCSVREMCIPQDKVFHPAPYLMLVISFLMESETVREWPASTDQRGGSRGLTARARAV